MIIIPLIAALLFLSIYLYDVNKYKNSSYAKITGYSYSYVMNDRGRKGEYFAFEKLKHLENSGAKFLFNVYIPKADGKTTEIDMLMICSTGIFVFEVKNYRGWIFGDEYQSHWYQILSSGGGKSRKEAFYNPIMQNRSHVLHLYELINEPLPIYSVVVFSNECSLAGVKIHSTEFSFVQFAHLKEVVLEIINRDNDNALDTSQITQLYDQLYPYSKVSEEQKAEHIRNIK